MNYTYIVTRQWVQTETIEVEADYPAEALKLALDSCVGERLSLPDQETLTVVLKSKKEG